MLKIYHSQTYRNGETSANFVRILLELKLDPSTFFNPLTTIKAIKLLGFKGLLRQRENEEKILLS